MLYLEISEDHKDAGESEARLKEGAFMTYGKLGKIRWSGKQVDVYAIEIWRLLGLAGFSEE